MLVRPQVLFVLTLLLTMCGPRKDDASAPEVAQEQAAPSPATITPQVATSSPPDTEQPSAPDTVENATAPPQQDALGAHDEEPPAEPRSKGCELIAELQSKALANWRAKVASCDRGDGEREIIAPEDALRLSCWSTPSGAWAIIPQRADLRNVKCAPTDASDASAEGQPHTWVSGTFAVVWSDGLSVRTSPTMRFAADLWGSPTCGACPWPGLKAEVIELVPLEDPSRRSMSIGVLLLRTGTVLVADGAELPESFDLTILAPKGDAELAIVQKEGTLRVELESNLEEYRHAALDLRTPLRIEACPLGAWRGQDADRPSGLCVEATLDSDLNVGFKAEGITTALGMCNGGTDNDDDLALILTCNWLHGRPTSQIFERLRQHCARPACTPLDDGREDKRCADSPLCPHLNEIRIGLKRQPPFAVDALSGLKSER